ncbi:DUF3048 domain-containing protein [Patescibacteria group bacterium]|nr:DUF3048 domain-containing protein [Patescibacteria group bacterium]
MQISAKSKLIIILVATYLSSAGLTFAFWPTSSGLVSPSIVTDPSGQPTIDPGEPRTEACPLNSALYTKTEKALWETRRPMVVMIENHTEARPQSGLSKADIVYETIAEGGITRFMAVYYCDAAFGDTILGPVRSARTYFLDWASEYSENPIYVHVGGANTPGKANALGQIGDYGWAGENDLNQFGLSVNECRRDYDRIGHDVATEHSMYCFTEALWKLADKRGWSAIGEDKESWDETFTSWKFTNKKPENGDPATNITFDFWDKFSQYTVNWQYSADTKVYKRINGGKSQIDNNTDNQLEATTVMIQFVTETGPIDDLKHMLYGTTGAGKAIVFTNGQAENLTWKKKTRLDRTIFYNLKGKEYNFQPGKIWIEAVSTSNTISY